MRGRRRSFGKRKDITKSTIEKKNVEEDEYKKYDAILNKLAQAVTFKEKQINQIDSDFSTSKRNPSVATRSNVKLTVSRTKDERNDKEFLYNIMNSDSTSLISPNNLHLLSDDDRNKSITSTEKFKNLSDLMIDDRNSHSEYYFTKNSEDRMILNLYSILGRKSKELFLEEEDKEKIAKYRILFKKLNNIKMPKFDFETKISSEKSSNIDFDQSCKGIEEDTNTEIKSVISEEKKEEKFDLFSDEDKIRNREECYFKQKEKPCFTIPELVDIQNYKKSRRTIKQKFRENYANFWDPEIDANTLSYINHNMICIEDIYNEKEKKEENEENIDEEKDLEIKAKEQKFSDSESEEDIENKGEIIDAEDIPKKCKNRFIEFFDVSPVQMGLSYLVDSRAVQENLDNMDLMEKNDLKLDRINAFDEKAFPKQGYKLSNDLIYRIAIRNDLNEIQQNERFSINASIDFFIKYKKNLEKNAKQKIIVERKSNIQPLKERLSEVSLTNKNVNKNELRIISDSINKKKENQNSISNESMKKKLEVKEKIKNDSSLQIENQEKEENENTLKDLINNESLFSNNINITNNNKEMNNMNNDEIHNNEPSYNTSNSNSMSNSQEKSKNINNGEKLYSDIENASQKKRISQIGNDSSGL